MHWLAVGVLVSALAVASPAYGEDNDAVLTLTLENFSDVTNDSEKIVLVDFFAPWCGHCKQLAPELEAAARILRDKHPNVVLATVDATVEEFLAQEHGVTGYPTLKVFRDSGKSYDYEGPREAAGIVEAMSKHASPNWAPPVDRVLVLTDDTFEDAIAEHDLIMVEWYAPWCGHCKQLEPEYEKAARYLYEHKPSLPIAKIDATVEKKNADVYDVKGYPTLKIFKHGVPMDYEGTRDAAGIVQEMIEHTRPAARAVDNLADFERLTKSDEMAVVGFFSMLQAPELQIFQQAADMLRKKFLFLYSTSEAVRKSVGAQVNQLGIVQPPRYLSRGEARAKLLTILPKTTPRALVDFIKANKYPLVGQLLEADSSASPAAREYSERPLVTLYFDVDWSVPKETQFWRSRVVQVAENFGSRTNRDVWFAFADRNHRCDLNDVGQGDSDEDAIAIIVDQNNRKYVLAEDVDADALHDFVEDFFDGKLTPFIKSQPAPRNNNGPVKVITGNNFDQLVTKAKEDIFIEFYAPWCGHCKALEPVWNKLGKKLASAKGIVVAKMDATANDPPTDYNIQGFPTIVLKTSNGITPFDGNRTLGAMLDWLREKSTAKIPKSRTKKKPAEAAKDEL
eukprot:m.456652 g.456652  ORF g.456652 m.456652 type:complete len:622 (-) comp20326_c2_seq126:6318-8183(-)